MTPRLSLVVPVYNEEENIAPLFAAIAEALPGESFELIFVDDGSSDATVERILALADPRVRLVSFARNFGQTSAMSAGIDAAEGDYIATLDGDLQNDPADIPLMIARLEAENLDIVMGRRHNRQDGALLRKLPSRIANHLIRRSTGVYISDYGCTLKVYRREIAKGLDLYGELHRFIPVLAAMQGARVAEMDVRHHARRFGVSKYGLGRTLRVVSDLLLMLFFMKYRQKPMHLFGSIGLVTFLIGGAIEAYLLVCKLMGEDIGQRPLFYIGILLLFLSVQFITTGFLAELMMRTYFESQNKKPYIVKRRG
jgi:glycosyltransferase involved in cell wall biosynthesis